jgi:hypothetical protein
MKKTLSFGRTLELFIDMNNHCRHCEKPLKPTQKQACSRKCGMQLARVFSPCQKGKGTRKGYTEIRLPSGKKVYRHRFIMVLMCRFSGLPFTSEMVVHHRNNNGLDNRISNLQLLNNQKEHFELHRNLCSIESIEINGKEFYF